MRRARSCFGVWGSLGTLLAVLQQAYIVSLGAAQKCARGGKPWCALAVWDARRVAKSSRGPQTVLAAVRHPSGAVSLA